MFESETFKLYYVMYSIILFICLRSALTGWDKNTNNFKYIILTDGIENSYYNAVLYAGL